MARQRKTKVRVPRGTTAVRWASGYAPGDPVDWRAVEIAALRDHPAVLSQLDPAGRYNGGRQYEPRRWFIVAPAVVAVLIIAGLPIWAYSTLFSQRWRRPSGIYEWTDRLPIASVMFALAALVIAVSLIVWLIRGSQGGGFLRSWSTLVLVLGSLSIFGLLVNGETLNEVPGADAWVAVIIGATLLATVTIVLVTALKRQADPDRDTRNSPEPLARVTQVFRKLADSEQEAVRQDLVRAADDLAARGVIEPRQAEWAKAAEPGRVALQMSQQSG